MRFSWKLRLYFESRTPPLQEGSPKCPSLDVSASSCSVFLIISGWQLEIIKKRAQVVLGKSPLSQTPASGWPLP